LLRSQLLDYCILTGARQWGSHDETDRENKKQQAKPIRIHGQWIRVTRVEGGHKGFAMENLYEPVDLSRLETCTFVEDEAYICEICFDKNIGCLPVGKKVGVANILW